MVKKIVSKGVKDAMDWDLLFFISVRLICPLRILMGTER